MNKSSLSETFEFFRTHLPQEEDIILTILKGHLIIEEQLWKIIDSRLPFSSALTEARITSSQTISIAEALIDDFTRQVQEIDWLWPALKKLNKLRNDIAHNLSTTGIEDRVTDFINRQPENLGTDNIVQNFQFALWTSCQEIHDIIEPITPEDYDFVSAE